MVAHVAGLVAQREAVCNSRYSCNRKVSTEDKRGEGALPKYLPACASVGCAIEREDLMAANDEEQIWGCPWGCPWVSLCSFLSSLPC